MGAGAILTLLIAPSRNALNYPAQIDTPANVNTTPNLVLVNLVRIAPSATLMFHLPNPHIHMKTYYKRFKPLNY